jgi:hypothetical protein
MSLHYTLMFAGALLVPGTAHTQPAWHVALNLDTQDCYRVTALPSVDNWRDGNGLGLAIVARIAELNDAEIDVT